MEKRSNSAYPASFLQVPTTFVQADTTSFRDLVQKLTGSSSDKAEKLSCSKSVISGVGRDPIGPRRSLFKLKERRHHSMRKLEIKLGSDFTNSSLVPSPVTPLSEFLFFPSPGAESPSFLAVSEEKKGFYLQPSPLTTPRGVDPPELLILFPLSSPNRGKSIGNI